MSWVTIIWSMAASACLTLAAMHLLVWCKKRTAWANLLFALSAGGTAGLAFCELGMMRAENTGTFGMALRWLHVPACVLIVSLVGFVLLYMRAGRAWLAWAVSGARTLSLILNFSSGQNLNYREITALRPIRFLGESVSVAVGVPNPWMLVGQASLLLLLVFVVDATLTVWRRGDRRQALLLGGSIIFFTLAGSGQAVLALWEIIPIPITASIFYMGFIAAMAYEMSCEALRAAQLAEDLYESEERMSMAAEAAGVGVWIWRITRNQVWGSERWLELFGFPPGAAISFEDVVQRIHSDDRAIVEREVERALLSPTEYEGEFRLVLPDGSQHWIAARGRVYPDSHGKPARMLGAAIEITERKRTEEGFRQVVEASPSGIVLVNREGRILLVNAETEKKFGYPREELIGHPVEMLIPKRLRDGHPGHRGGFFAAPQTRTLSAGRELFALRRDGTEFPVDIGLRPIQNADGVHVLVTILDITARKQAEAETLRQRDELAHVTRVSTMGQLASSLAHELNQPLGAILRNAEAAELFLKESVPDLDEVRAILADIRKDDQRAGEVIDRVRALMKRRQVQRGLIKPTVLVGEVVALVRPDAEIRQVRLALEVGTALPPVHGDRVQLQQVLLNLLLNAMDALNENPPASRLVAVRARHADATVEFAVSDNGHGIPADKLLSVFEPFFTSKPNGLGMGLTISRNIIEAHGGRLWAENDAAGGATFTFALPAATGGDAK